MASSILVFAPYGDLTFVLQSLVKEPRRKGSSLLSYRPHKSKFAKVYMRVSSRLVMRASPVFKAMLKHSFREGLTLRSTGKVEIPLPDDDPTVFALLMDIVHGNIVHRGRPPPPMDTLFLTKIAILVDKYRLQKHVAMHSNAWVESLRGEIPQTFGPDLIHWLCISWVFRRPAEFNFITRIAERESLGQDLDTYSPALKENLPIPERIIDNILSRRLKAIQSCFDVIGRYIDVLQAKKPRCTSSRSESHRYTCNNILLGSLLESSTSLGLWPPADAPYKDLNFTFLAREVMQIKVVSFCSKMGYTNHPTGSHGVKAEIGSALVKLKTRFSGLHLKDYD
ncbi:uncharacterized protein L3040_005820 [Drepanopeziza brunnea f. sp. 'multigermtubi']|uniref:uncharacterized protein n=1 Tax=Drepanopeziza brunnea f. sp. 'multigermtubi' TaxID=698441 RepID=UPI002391D432|nr:hypothetical protein L3040_005820 [Drepanopeziza brunnea f. sp. 'multigermtubi']